MYKLIFLLAVCFSGTAQALFPDDDFVFPFGCGTWGKRDTTAPTCAQLAAASTSVTVSPTIYGPPGIHYVVMASDYYMARMALGLNSRSGSGIFSTLCPGDESKWNSMQLSTSWTGIDSGQAWDWGFNVSVIRRQCLFPDGTYPFLCQGLAGTPGTYGDSLGWLSYIPLATDTVNNYWTLFGNCWDPARPGHTGTNYARSWIVFNKIKTLETAERDLIISTITGLGFDTSKVFDTTFVNPTYNPIPPYP